jgi:CheY-like chemotaxis protein
MLLQFILERQHFRVLAAESTEEAREHLESETISCVVSDVFMPNKSGTEFIAELRNSTEYANLPVILLTAGAKDLEWAALESGADVFCEKKDAKKLLGRQIRLLIN